MKKYFIIGCIIQCIAATSHAQIDGFVFKDFNGDGIWQQSIEPASPDVYINAYDNSNTLIAFTTSAINGSYSLPVSVQVRVEFIVGNGNCIDSLYYFNVQEPYGNNVRFLNPPLVNENFGIQNPSEFDLQIDPLVFVPRLNYGDPLDPNGGANIGASGAQRAFYAHRLYENNVSSTYIPPYVLKNSEIGSCWGVAYNKKAKKVFTAAFLKRCSGMGPMGSGGIYKLDTTAAGGFNVTQFYDMDANGHRTRASSTAVAHGLGTSYNLNGNGTQATYLGPIDALTSQPEGLGVIGTNADRGLTFITNPNGYYDPTAFDQVGKVGLGDIEFSDDGKFLYVMNLYSRKLFRLEMDNAFDPQMVVNVNSYDLPNITINNGVLRGFTCTFYNSKVYVGAVSTAENGGSLADLNAYVFELLDPTDNAIFNPIPIYTLALNYPHLHGTYTNWHPWNSATNVYSTSKYWVPMLSNIEFTDKGDLLLDFMDRSGHHHGITNPRNLSNATPGSIGFYNVGGDIAIAGFNCSTGSFTTENNGSYSSQGVTYTSSGMGSGAGIGGGEFFVGDNATSSYNEVMVGALAKKPHCDSIIVTSMGHTGIVNNSTVHLSLINGEVVTGAIVNAAGSTPNFAKSNSLGDIEMVGDALPIHIGNRVWLDKNNDGIQGASEPGIANVSMDLFADFNNDLIPDGTALATTITDANGQYYFNETNVLDGDPIAIGMQKGISAHTYYIVRINSLDWNGVIGINDLNNMLITKLNVGATTTPLADIRDNDCDLLNGFPQLQVHTRLGGKNLFNEDFGFINCIQLNMNDQFLTCANTSAIIGPDSIPIANTILWSPAIGLSSTTIINPIASPSTTTVYTLTLNNDCINTVVVNTDFVLPIVDAGANQKITCRENANGVLLGVPMVAGYTYSWAPNIGLSIVDSAQTWANPKTKTTYTLTAKGSNVCSSSTTITVDVNKCCTRVVIPNSFSPNGDGINDEFGVIEIEDLQNFTLAVFNRFGEKVFEAVNDKNKMWNGEFNKRICDVGTYFYMLRYKCSAQGQEIFLKGDVSLIP